jgi:DNA-binding NarL/FixJ family response regulator
MPSTDPDPTILGPQEREVAMLLAEGLSKKQIAYRRHRSVRTIDSQVARIYAKLDLDDRVAVCRWAIRCKLIRA